MRSEWDSVDYWDASYRPRESFPWIAVVGVVALGFPLGFQLARIVLGA